MNDEIKQFDPLMFSIPPSECDLLDPQHICVYECFEDAHIDPIELRGTNTSVYVGISTFDYQNNLKNSENVLDNYFGLTGHSASNRISYSYDFRGQSLSIDTACSSSSNSIALDYQSIIDGKSNYSVVGGTNLILDETVSKAFSKLNMLSPTGKCKSFDADADGYVRGEGVCVLLLKNLEQAINDDDRIYCVINGVNSNEDGNCDKNNFYSPSKTGQYLNTMEMFNSCSSRFTPSDIDYCELHATGTPVGDPIEVEAISMAFKEKRQSDYPLLVGSIKSNIGHLEACSGIASIIKCCLMFKNRQFVPNINFNKPNPAIKFDEWNLKVVTEVLPFPTNKKVSMLINNFGITGSNVVMVLSEFNNKQKEINKQEHNKSYLIPVSANSKQSLDSYIQKVKSININNCEFFDFVQYQILSKSTKLYQRSVILASEWSDLLNDNNIIKTNNSTTSNLKSSEKSNNNEANICFVFSGQGTQYVGMAQQLYLKDSLFKSTVDIIDSKLKPYFGYSVFERYSKISDDSIHQPVITQPVLCMIQVALFETLTKQYGIKPNFIIGHSLGELVASYCSGTIDLDTYCYISYNRAIIQQNTLGSGKMLSVNMGAEEFNEKYSDSYPSLEIACYNSQNSIVIAGNEYLLKDIESKLKSNEIHTAFLTSPSSFHSSSQEVCKQDLLNLKFESKSPTIPILSTVYQDFFNTDTRPFNAEYCYRNVREPVYFTQAVQKLYQHLESNQSGINNLIFVEVAPHSVLTYHLKQLIPKKSSIKTTILGTLNKTKSDISQIHQLLSTLYCNHNYSISFKNQLKIKNRDDNNNNNSNNNESQQSYKYKELNLPKYQWDNKVYYKEDSLQNQNRLNGSAIEILGKRNPIIPFISFKTIIDIDKPQFQYLKGHQVEGQYYLPGCGYIENILNSFPSNTDICISYLEFKSPLVLIEGISKQLQTNIYQTSKKDYRVQFHYYESKTNKWIQSSSGNIQLYNSNSSKEKKLDIQQLKSKCNLTQVEPKDFYSIKSKASLELVGNFKTIKEAYIGDNAIFTVVPFRKVHDNVNTKISCATLDSCVNHTMAFVEDSSKMVFDKFENFHFYSSNFPSDYSGDLYSYSQLNKKMGNSFEVTTYIMIQDGTIIFEIEKGILTSITPIKDSLVIQYPLDEMSTTYLELKDLGNINNNHNTNNINNNVILYGDIKNNQFKEFIKQSSSSNQIINSIQEFNDISSNIKNNTTIYFTKTVNQLNRTNFKQITLEYIQIVQFLIKNQLKGSTKFVLISSNNYSKESSNYLASAVLGSFKYFIDQFPSILLYSFDFDDKSLLNLDSINIISQTIENSDTKEREFIIRDNKLYTEKIRDEQDILNKFKTESIENPNQDNNLISTLNENLEFQLESKVPVELGEDQVEIQVKSIGVNYKDYLVYTRNVPVEIINHNSDPTKAEFGLEYSGIVKAVGSNAKNQFKVGDRVYSIDYCASSSSLIVDKNHLSHMPNNLNFVQAASIPIVYLTSYISIFEVAKLNIENQESILIHAASGGVGLSAIELLRWKGYKSNLFVTVGSKEKEQYLKERYGSFITGIYSTLNKDYVLEIKKKLKELNSEALGVDVILNTLPAEHIESNFRCLNPMGRIVDLSITHLNQNEFIDFSKFKYNLGYSNFELMFLDFKYLTKVLNRISEGISNGSLSLIPITEFSVTNIKDAFEYINQRKYIGKIVVNYDNDIKSNLIANNKQNEVEPIIKSNYSITSELGKTILVTGQTGIALEIIKWINRYSSVENIIILSKSKLKWELELLINKSRSRSIANGKKPINFYFKSVDIESYKQLEDAVNQVFNENPKITNIESIFHFAFTHTSSEPLQINIEHLNLAHGTKSIGAINLHELSIYYNWKINNFVLASSISAIFGGYNQYVYISSNSVLDGLAKYRKSIGLSALSINWGHIGTTGIVTRLDSVGDILKSNGLEPMPSSIILGTLDLLIQNRKQLEQDYGNIIVNRLNLDTFPSSLLINHKIENKIKLHIKSNNNNNNNNSLNSTEYNSQDIKQKLISKISELLSIDESNINTSIKLSEYGFESLLVVKVKNWIDKTFKKKLNISELQNHTINSIHNIIINK